MEKKPEEEKKEEEEEEKEKEEEPEKKKKKKKKHHKKKKQGPKQPNSGIRENPYRSLFKPPENIEITNSRAQDNSHFRVLGSWEEKPWTQTNFPTKDIDELFPNNDWPIGILQEYSSNNIWRSTDKEKIELERTMQTDIQSFRKGAECHRQIRKYAQQIIKPGRKMIDIVIDIERCLNFITNAHGLDIGQSFPTGCSLNNVAAHYTPNPGDETVLQKDDICKIDFGTHVNGLVIDCAFSVAFNPQYDNLLLATKEATNEGIKTAGIDVRMDEIGKVIQEVIESYEVEIDGKMKKLKPIKNLCGHTVGRYKVHAGKTVPCVVNYENVKMEEGEMYAIETFASTGKGEVKPIIDCSHYMLEQYATGENLRKKEEKELFEYIKGKYSTLAWCKRWLVEDGFKNVSLPLRHMINAGVVQEYPPLADIDGSFTSQFEHTFMLLPTKKEIFTVGDDY